MIKNRKIKWSIITLIILFMMLIGFIYFGELGINKNIPKRAKYVRHFIMR